MLAKPLRIPIDRKHLIFPPEQAKLSPVSAALEDRNLYYQAVIPHVIGQPLRITPQSREPGTLKLAGLYSTTERAAEYFHEYLFGETVPEADLLLSPAHELPICDILPRS